MRWYGSLAALAGITLLSAGLSGCALGDDSSEDVGTAEQADTPLGPSEVSVGVIGPTVGASGSSCPPRRVSFPFERTFAAPPVLLSTAQGELYQDTFAVTTTSVGTRGFDANVYRADVLNYCWAQTLRLGWLALPPTNLQHTQAGTFNVGSYMSGGRTTVSVTFPHGFSVPPRVMLTARGQNYQDTFVATTRVVTPTGFVANVQRLDGGGWGQQLQLDWVAWDSGSDLAPLGAADGTAPVPNGNSSRQSFWVPFPPDRSFAVPPVVLATTRGQNYQDSFAVSAVGATTRGFWANVQRVDAGVPWGQALQLDWLAVPSVDCPQGQVLDSASGACSPAPQPPDGTGNTVYGRWTGSGGQNPSDPGNRSFLARIGAGPARITLTSSADAYLYLLDLYGNVIAADDNSGGGTNAQIYTSVPAGTYRVVAATRAPGQAADFTLSSDTAFLRFPQSLDVMRADRFVWVYDDVGTGSDGDVSVWRADLSAYPGYYSLGDVAMPYYGPPRGGFVVRGEGDLLARPIDYNFVWNDQGSGGDHDASVWDPVPPAGYTCVGTVVTLGYGKPSTDLIRCIKSEYLLGATPSYVWDDAGSGAHGDVAMFQADPSDHRTLPLSTFGSLPYYGNPGGRAYFALNKSAVAGPDFWGTPVDAAKAQRYAPRVWMHRNEYWFPSSVDYFLPNVHPAISGGQTYYVTNQSLGCDRCTDPPFLPGQRPDATSVPVYAEMVNRTTPGVTDVIYWTFYPYNKGKDVCIGVYDSNIGCIGSYQSYGNHVGDLEHVTVRFVDGRPYQVYLSEHDHGWLLGYGDKLLSLSGGHPEVYAALGSHGLYPGEDGYVYQHIPNGDHLVDYTQRGLAWDTWNNVVTFPAQPAGTYSGSLAWLNYTGYWGNPESGCDLLGIIPFDYCALDGGPSSIVTRSISDPAFMSFE